MQADAGYYPNEEDSIEEDLQVTPREAGRPNPHLVSYLNF